MPCIWRPPFSACLAPCHPQAPQEFGRIACMNAAVKTATWRTDNDDCLFEELTESSQSQCQPIRRAHISRLRRSGHLPVRMPTLAPDAVKRYTTYTHASDSQKQHKDEQFVACLQQPPQGWLPENRERQSLTGIRLEPFSREKSKVALADPETCAIL